MSRTRVGRWIRTILVFMCMPVNVVTVMCEFVCACICLYIYFCIFQQYRLKSFHNANKGWQATIICPTHLLFSLLYKKYFHKHYSLGICGWLYSNHYNLKHYMGKPFGRINATETRKNTFKHTKPDTDSWVDICAKNFHLSSNMNIQNMPEEPSNNP